jgi:hypothetical protein
MPAVPAPKKLMLENLKFKISLGKAMYIERPCLSKTNKPGTYLSGRAPTWQV